MLYWYTGQPGHGKTLNAIDFAIGMKQEADAKHASEPAKYPKRELFICNVREMQHSKVGAVELLPDEFKAWADSPTYIEERAKLLERRSLLSKDQWQKAVEELESQPYSTQEINPRYLNAIILIDEAYEHGMLPKRPPGAAVPRHVERMAKHRHYGIDFICVSQSPDKQCDQFVHDLIERHVHVRRKFGSNWVQLREFHRFESNAERALPIVNRNVHLLKGKRSVGTYKSTELDTTERRIPWYYYAFGLGIPAALVLFWYVFGNLGDRLTGQQLPTAAYSAGVNTGASEAHGAGATGAVARAPSTPEEYAAALVPRVPSQPWSAPIYDAKLSVSSEPPRLFCMLAGPGEREGGYRENSSCTCLTEQGTRYWLEMQTCATIARHGQYEPFYQERSDQRMVDGGRQQEMLREDLRLNRSGVLSGSVGTAPEPAVAPEFGTITRSAP